MISPKPTIQRTSIADQHLDRQPIHGYEFLRCNPTKSNVGSLATAVFHPDVNARRLTGGVMPSRQAGISAVSSIAPSPVALCSQVRWRIQDLYVSGTDGPFKVTTSSSTKSQPSTLSDQAVGCHWDRLPVPGEDFLKRKSTKTKLGSVAPPSDMFSATEHFGVMMLLAVLGTDSLSWRRPFEAHPHLNQISARS